MNRSLFSGTFLCAALLASAGLANAAPLGTYSSHAILTTPAAIEITDNSGKLLRLRAYGDDMVRVQASDDATFLPDDHYQMVEHHNHGGSLTILSDDATSLVIASGDIRVTVSKNPLRLSFADAGGNTILSDSSGIDLDPAVLSYNFTADNAEKFIGYGQKRLALQDTFQLAGRTERRNYNENGFPGRGSQGVVIVPFYMSSKGYGFFANSTYPNEGRFNVAGDYSFRLETAGEAAEADYFFILGPAPADILEAYTRLTGRPRMLGKSYFGIHLSDNDPQIPGLPNINQQWWETMTTNHHNAGLPLDHMVFDNDWRAASPLPGGVVGQWGGSQFAFEATRYPDPASFRQSYDAKGLTLTLDLNLNNCNDSEGWNPSFNLDPSITTNHGNSEPDYWNPATRNWFWNLMWNKAFNPALGYPGDAIWLDESDGVGRPNSHIVSNGRTWREMKNYYFFQTAYAAVAEGWDNVEGEPHPALARRNARTSGSAAQPRACSATPRTGPVISISRRTFIAATSSACRLPASPVFRFTTTTPVASAPTPATRIPPPNSKDPTTPITSNGAWASAASAQSGGPTAMVTRAGHSIATPPVRMPSVFMAR
jgi:alpha-glucosidase (family GH31 glycosyl hydrolase)